MTTVPPGFSQIHPPPLPGSKIKVEICNFVSDTCVFFQINQKSFAGAHCLGFKKVSGGGITIVGRGVQFSFFLKNKISYNHSVLLHFWEIYIFFNVSSEKQEIFVQIFDYIVGKVDFQL